jgi:hypothetical protein
MLGKRKVQKLLQSYADRGTADPERDLPLLRRMKESLSAVDRNLLATKPLPINGLDTDLEAVANTIEIARELLDALRLPDMEQDELRSIGRSVATCLRATVENNTVRQAGDRLLAAIQGLETAGRHFSDLSGRDIRLGQDETGVKTVRENLEALANARHLLRDWAAWCRIRNRALASSLASMVEQIERGEVQPDEARVAFPLGYSRWWLPKVLDADPVLRNFRRFQHENAIKEFREIDDLVRSHATHHVIGAIAHGLPPVQSVPRNSELGLLRHQMELQRPSQSIRDIRRCSTW